MTTRRILVHLFPALLAAVALFPCLSASVPAGGCGSCSGADRAEVAFRATAALAAGGTLTITLAGVSATGSGGPGPVSTTTGLAAFPPETVVDGTITLTGPALSCGLNEQASADFIPSAGCGQTAEIRTKLPDETSFGPWSADLHPEWAYFSGAAPVTIEFQLRILRADPGIAAAPPAISETSPPTLSGDGNGGLQPTPPSFSARIPLGGAPGSGPFNAGSLVVSGPLDASLASAANLAVRNPLGLLTVHSTGSNPPVPTRILSATRLLDIEEITANGSPDGFRVRVFEAGDFTPQGPASGAVPSVSHRFRPVPGGLTVETTRRASPAMESATYTAPNAAETTVTLAGGLEIRATTTTFTQDNGRHFRHDQETVTRDGVPYAKTIRDYLMQTVPSSVGGTLTVTPFLIAENTFTVIDENTFPDETSYLPLTRTPSPFPGLPETVSHPDGYWEKHTYYDGTGADGGQTTWLRLPKSTLTPWNGSPAQPPASGSTGCNLTTHTYTAVDGILQPAGRATTLPPAARVMPTQPATQELAALITLLGAHSGITAAWLPQPADLAALRLADLADPANPSSSEQIPATTIRYRSQPAFCLSTPPPVAWAGRTFASLDAEGDGSLTAYEPGAYNPDTGTFTPLTPTAYAADPATATHLRSLTLRLRNSALPADGEKTLHLTIEDRHGRTIRDELHLRDGATWSLATVTTTTYDDAPADGSLAAITRHHDGRLISETIRLTPFETVSTDEQGIKTTTRTDALGRVTAHLRHGVPATASHRALPDITTTTAYSGRTAATTTSAPGLSFSTTDAADLAGRPISRTDPTGAVTTTAYPDHGRTTTVTYPGNNTLITTRTIDRLPVAVTGTAAVHEFTSRQIDSAGHLLTTRHSATAQSGRATTRVTDPAGRHLATITPSPADDSATVTTTTAYEPGTRRAKSITSSAANTAAQLLIRPDPASSLTRAGLDADSDGDLTPASADRLTETRQSYAKVGTRWWRITEEKTYDQTGSAASAIITTTKERLHGNADGHASAIVHILPGGGTVTTTTAIDRAARTLTTTTTRSGHALPETTVNLNGLEISRTSHHFATPARFGHDNLGRLIVEVSPTGAATVMERDPAGRLKSVTSPSGHTTAYTYWPADHHAAGRLKTTTLPSPLPVGEGQGEGVQHTTTREWSTRGELLAITGTASYPVAYTYDAHGALETQTTWRDANDPATAQTTTWIYRPNSGVLWKRVNADTKETLHTYHPNGLPHTRTRPGGATTTWTYNPLGDLTAIDYTGDADRTPDVAITAHTRLGAPVTITQSGIGTETRAYHPGTGAPASVTYPTTHALLSGKSIAWPEPDPFGRPLGLTPSDGPLVAYGWNDQGLLETVTAGTATHTYAYRPGTDWRQNITANDGTANTFRQHYARDKAGRLLSATSHTLAGTAPAALTHYAYQHDELDRPYRATLLDGSTWTWARNERGEIISAVRKLPDATEVPALGAGYEYDDIGNRKTATSPILGDFDYTPNSVNQYTSIATNDTRTVLGNAPVSPAVTVNDGAVDRIPPDTGTIFHKAITGTNLNAPVWLEANVSDGTTTETRHTWLPASATSLQYDDDGNLTHDGQWTYLWDAENRLVEMETTEAAVTAGRPYRRLTFAYDWTGRRLARTVYGPNATILSATRWLYDGWNPVAEFSDQTTGQTLVHAYLWGMDMSGTMQGAGGVGGLLSVSLITNNTRTNNFLPSYDGNGNIVAWTPSGATAPTCLREYDAFGNILIEHGTPPCQFGFSTKLEDPEAGLLYYGYRYLSPPLGRWLGRDPIEEEGGLNLYGFVGNDGITRWDTLGLHEGHECPRCECLEFFLAEPGPGIKADLGKMLAEVALDAGSAALNLGLKSVGLGRHAQVPRVKDSQGAVLGAYNFPDDGGDFPIQDSDGKELRWLIGAIWKETPECECCRNQPDTHINIVAEQIGGTELDKRERETGTMRVGSFAALPSLAGWNWPVQIPIEGQDMHKRLRIRLQLGDDTCFEGTFSPAFGVERDALPKGKTTAGVTPPRPKFTPTPTAPPPGARFVRKDPKLNGAWYRVPGRHNLLFVRNPE